MIKTYLTGVLLVACISALWLWVQRLWRRQFPDAQADALANRSACGNCQCNGSGCEQPDLQSVNREAG